MKKLDIQKLKNTRMVYGVISIILAATIAFVAIPLLSRQKSSTTEILSVTNSISKGDVISADDIEIIEVGEFNLNEDIIKEMSEVIGKYAATDLVVGDYILTDNLTVTYTEDDINLDYIPDGKMAMSFTVKSLATGLSTKIQTDDIIRLYYYNDQAISYDELSFVKVLSVTNSDGYDINTDEDEEKTLSSTITVLVSPEQAMKITEMESAGSIHVTLISRNNIELANELLERQDSVITELYTEEIVEDEIDNIEGE